MKKIIASLLLFLAVPLFAGEDWQAIPIGPFGTLNNRESSFAIQANQAQDLLNVDITIGGKSVKSRKGYVAFSSFTPSTSPIHNVSFFFDQSGNDVALAFHERKIDASLNGGAFSTIYSSGTNEAVYDCSDYLGFNYCANSARDGLFKTNGVTVSNVNTIISSGTMVTTCPTRLAMAGFSGLKASEIDFSADTDFTTWGTGALGSSPVQLNVTSNGSRITHLTYAFGRLMWFKDNSFGYVLIGNQAAQSDWVITTVSNNIGTLDNTSVQDPQGNLYFRGQDKHIYRFDGSQAVDFSQEIIGTISSSTQTATEQAYAYYYDTKLWFSIASGSAQQTNNRVLIYDFNVQGWTVYDLKANGFYTRKNQLYFGDSTQGKVHQFGSQSGNFPSDDGTAIKAYWQSKDFFLTSPFKTLNLENMSVICDSNLFTSSMTVFAFNELEVGQVGQGFTINLLHSDYPQDSYRIVSNKNFVPGSATTRRHSFSVKILNTGTSVINGIPVPFSGATFQVYGIQFGVRENSWIPEP